MSTTAMARRRSFTIPASVGFLSIHRYPFYPGTGARRRDRNGQGTRVHDGTSPFPTARLGHDYHAAFRAGLEHLADRIKPELVLISAGFDAHAEDPVGTWD